MNNKRRPSGRDTRWSMVSYPKTKFCCLVGSMINQESSFFSRIRKSDICANSTLLSNTSMVVGRAPDEVTDQTSEVSGELVGSILQESRYSINKLRITNYVGRTVIIVH